MGFLLRDEVAVDDGRVNVAAGITLSEDSTIARFMRVTGGNPSSIVSHVLPSSFEPNSFPLRVKKIPTGSKESTVIASRKTVS